MALLAFKDWKIRVKIAATTILIVAVAVIVLGSLTYRSMHQNILQTIEDQLKQQALDWKQIIEGVYGQIVLSDENAEKTAKVIVQSQIEAVYRFIETYSGENLETLKNTIASIKVGKTGYVYVLDYEGNYVVSAGRKRDGENIWDATDSDGKYFIREMIQKGKALTGNQVDYQRYPWKNIGEDVARDKLAAFVHVPKYRWVVGIGAYYDELADVSFAKNQIENLKNRIASQKVGDTGYIYVLDGKGSYVVSLNRERDGENIWDAKDASGVYFIQEIVKKGKALSENRADFQYYPWKNQGEATARMKVAGISYVPGLDWTIGVSAYHADFFGPLYDVRNTVIMVVVISILVATFVALAISNVIVKPINSLLKVSTTAAEGNLAVEIDVNTKDEIGKLAGAFDLLIKNLSKIVLRIRETTEKVTSRAQTLSASAQEMNASTAQTSSNIQQIAKGANSQAQKASEVSNVMEQMASSVTQVASNARSTSVASEQATKSAKEGYEATLISIEKMNKIVDIVNTSADTIKVLSNKTEEIGEIVNVITNISDQTNLLALNAAIEAARAGEAGRGFAVVAEEVRKLAENAAKASEQISKLIKGVQEESVKSANFMQQGTKEVNEGKEISGNVGEALKEITKEIERTRDMVQQIATSAEQQLKGTEQTVKAVEEIAGLAKKAAQATEEASSATEEQTASMEELAASAQELSHVAIELSEVVSMFKVAEEEEKAMYQHHYEARSEGHQYAKDSKLHPKPMFKAEKEGHHFTGGHPNNHNQHHFED